MTTLFRESICLKLDNAVHKMNVICNFCVTPFNNVQFKIDSTYQQPRHKKLEEFNTQLTTINASWVLITNG